MYWRYDDSRLPRTICIIYVAPFYFKKSNVMYVEENAGSMDAGSWEIKYKCADNLEFKMTLSQV